MKNRHPVLLWTGMLLLIGLACAASGGNTNTPSIAVTQMITMSPNGSPSFETPATVIPTATKIPAFFTEEFGADFDAAHWQQFTLGKGSPSQLVVQQEDGHLLFDIGSDDLYVYYMYKPYTYRNTSIKLNAQNLGRNNNNVSLVCRMHDESKWYEFSVTNSGLWTLFAFDQIYHILGSGGTNLLRPEREENEYGMVCQDDKIQLFINGQEIKTVQDTRFGFQEGYAGFNISSVQGYSVLPITVQVNRFEIALPE